MSSHLREVEIDWEWHGEAVTLKMKLSGADPDVGIMGPQPEDLHMFRYDTDEEIPLTDGEIDGILSSGDTRLWSKIEDAYYHYNED